MAPRLVFSLWSSVALPLLRAPAAGFYFERWRRRLTGVALFCVLCGLWVFGHPKNESQAGAKAVGAAGGRRGTQRGAGIENQAEIRGIPLFKTYTNYGSGMPAAHSGTAARSTAQALSRPAHAPLLARLCVLYAVLSRSAALCTAVCCVRPLPRALYRLILYFYFVLAYS